MNRKKKFKEIAGTAVSSLLMIIILVGVLWSVKIRIDHPEFTETQIFIKMFIWDYEGE